MNRVTQVWERSLKHVFHPTTIQPMSTRARTRAAAAASTSKVASQESTISQSKPKSQACKEPEEKENVKSKTVKASAKTPSKAVTSTAQRRSTRSTPNVYCTCKKGDDGTPMVQCAECRTWYHFRCIELKEEDAEEIMTWEGEEALEKPSEQQPDPVPKKKPAAKKTKLATPVEPPPSPPSESEGDASSEDEYVVEEVKARGQGATKRPTRRLSYSSEPDSEVSDDAKPRRHRIKKLAGSPPPSNALKRKDRGSSHTPPPKRKKSDAADPTDDPVRKYCLTKLEELFRDVFMRYPHVQMQNDGGETSLVQKPLDQLTEDEKIALLDESKRFADELEKCVFDTYSEHDKFGHPTAGSNYKDRFRMLQFNLSKADRVGLHKRIVSAEISAKEISTMSSTDLANEETKQSIKMAEKESLAYSILTPTTAPRAKITHKGLEDIEDVHGRTTTLLEEERLRKEAEERRERERIARFKAQSEPRQRTASLSVPPESPIVGQSSQPWGGPPAVPLHALSPTDVSQTSFVSQSPTATTFSQPFIDASEPELNLADFINIDEETPSAPATLESSSLPSTLVAGEENETSLTSQPESSPISPTGISPFAQKSEPTPSTSFDLNALWNAPKAEPLVSVLPAEESTGSTSSPKAVTEDKDTVMDVEGGGTDDYDFDMFLEEKDAASNSAEAQQAAFDALPSVWTGKINMPTDSTTPQEISVNARQVGGRSLEHESVLWKTLFPSELLRIDGRVPVKNSSQFLLQMRMNSAKELVAVAFTPSEDSDVGFRLLSDFLIAKGRHGLVFPWGQKVKDHHPGRELYIIPLLSSDPLPDYMELLDDLRLPKLRNANLLVGIWVLNKGKLVPPTTVAPSPPVHQPVQPVVPAAPTPPFPQITPPAPPLPPAIAAEVATLTPEQIQLMIRTLTANGALPLPRLSMQQQPPVPAHQPPPPPPPTMLSSQQHPNLYPPFPPPNPTWSNNGHAHGYSGGIYQHPSSHPPLNTPMQRPPPLSWDRPGGKVGAVAEEGGKEAVVAVAVDTMSRQSLWTLAGLEDPPTDVELDTSENGEPATFSQL
ncbi:hypothetical protein H0H92_006287 [Tricholoma furcatifolium]|nr:hypothetical protein H0H92_006287 [Tricholoma furcatifolium]